MITTEGSMGTDRHAQAGVHRALLIRWGRRRGADQLTQLLHPFSVHFGHEC